MRLRGAKARGAGAEVAVGDIEQGQPPLHADGIGQHPQPPQLRRLPWLLVRALAPLAALASLAALAALAALASLAALAASVAAACALLGAERQAPRRAAAPGATGPVQLLETVVELERLGQAEHALHARLGVA